MKLNIKPGTTSRTVRLFIQDSSSTTGDGLTGVAFGDISAYYIREGDASPTVITLATATVGTWTSSGFKEIDATNMPGWYELGLPNAVLAAGAVDVGVHLKGATNMAPLPLEIQLGTLIPELTGVPDAAPDITDAVALRYMIDSNARITNSATEEDKISNRAGTVILERDFTDASSILTTSKVRVP